MPPANPHTEYHRNLSDALKPEAVAFLNSGGGDIVVGVCRDGVESISKARSLS